MHSVARQVRRTISHLNLIPRGASVVVALSGGPDSVALVHVLVELAGQGDLSLAGLAHLNHGIRGEAAGRDERFCQELARELGLPFDAERTDVPALAAASRRSVEDAGRAARYAFLRRAAARLGADRIAVGHTRDDQAETFLLQLIRGAGPRGLAGIHPRVGPIVRPLIRTSREALRDYLAHGTFAFVVDETNADRALLRNRVRLELIPRLQQAFSPAIVQVLCREAEIARVDADYLESEAQVAFGGLVSQRGGVLDVDAGGLLEAPPALAWRVARAALRQAGGGRFVGYEAVQRLLALARNGPGLSVLQFPGATACWQEGRLHLRPGRRDALPEAGMNISPILLSIPGEAHIQALGLTLTARRAVWPDRDSLNGGDLPAGAPDTALVDADTVPAVLAVRTRRPGDWFRPLGMSGRKKLQDFFVDRKVPRAERDRTPLVVDGADRIVWVGGHVIAEDFRVTGRTKAVVILKLHETPE